MRQKKSEKRKEEGQKIVQENFNLMFFIFFYAFHTRIHNSSFYQPELLFHETKKKKKKKPITTMELIPAQTLEYTLKHWLKSSHDQFKPYGCTVKLSNLDINYDSLHLSIELPSVLNVTTTKVNTLRLSFLVGAAVFVDLVVGI